MIAPKKTSASKTPPNNCSIIPFPSPSLPISQQNKLHSKQILTREVRKYKQKQNFKKCSALK